MKSTLKFLSKFKWNLYVSGNKIYFLPGEINNEATIVFLSIYDKININNIAFKEECYTRSNKYGIVLKKAKN